MRCGAPRRFVSRFTGSPNLGPPSWQFFLKDGSILAVYRKRGGIQNTAQCLGPGVKQIQNAGLSTTWPSP